MRQRRSRGPPEHGREAVHHVDAGRDDRVGVGLGFGAAVVVLGLGLAPIFPPLVSMKPRRVGRFHTPQAVGFQVAASAVGVVIFPSLVGLLSRSMGLEILGLYLIAASLLLLAVYEVTMRLAGRHESAPGTEGPRR